jgi:chromosome segregation protein
VPKGLKELKKKMETSSGGHKEEAAYIQDSKFLRESLSAIEEKEEIDIELKKMAESRKEVSKDLPKLLQEGKELSELLDMEKKDKAEKIDNLENLDKQIDKTKDKRGTIQEEIEKLKVQKQELNDKYYGQMIDFTKYQFLVNDIKWMTEMKQKLQERQDVKAKIAQERKERAD